MGEYEYELLQLNLDIELLTTTLVTPTKQNPIERKGNVGTLDGVNNIGKLHYSFGIGNPDIDVNDIGDPEKLR